MSIANNDIIILIMIHISSFDEHKLRIIDYKICELGQRIILIMWKNCNFISRIENNNIVRRILINIWHWDRYWWFYVTDTNLLQSKKCFERKENVNCSWEIINIDYIWSVILIEVINEHGIKRHFIGIIQGENILMAIKFFRRRGYYFFCC